MKQISHKKVLVFVLSIVGTTLTIGTSLVFAAITISSSGVSSDQSINLTSGATSTFDFGSSTLNFHTVNGGPITTGNGLFTVGGPLLVNDTSTLNGALTVSSTATFKGNVQIYGPGPWVDVRAYGAKGDGKTVSDASISSGANSLTTVSSGKFSANDVGKTIIVVGAGASGGNLVTTIASFVSSNSITTAASAATTVGPSATVYWGTDDAAAIANALTAAIGGTLFFPLPSQTCYLMDTTMHYSSALGITIVGAGYGSQICGDPGDNALIQTTGSAANIDIRYLRLANVHAPIASDNGNYFCIYFDPAVNASVDHIACTAGRGIEVYGASRQIRITNNYFLGVYDWAVGTAGGSVGTNVSDVTISGNVVSGTKTSGVHGPPDDINIEDSDNVVVSNNMISDGSGITEAAASCIQVYASLNSMNRIVVQGNTCHKSPAGTFNGMNVSAEAGVALNGVIVTGNSIDGYGYGISGGDGNGANALNPVIITGNSVTNSQTYGIYYGANGLSTENLQITGNEIVGPGNVAGALAGIRLNRIRGAIVSSNHISQNGTHGIMTQGTQQSSFSGNVIFDNGKNAAGDGINLGTFSTGSVSSTNNVFTNNSVFDDQGSPTQRWAININASSTANQVIGLVGYGNTSGTINDLSNSLRGRAVPAQIIYGFCTGTASSSGTFSLFGLGAVNSFTCSSLTGLTAGEPMPSDGILTNLRVVAAVAGTSSISGVFAVNKNGTATGITCTVGTGTTCSDTAHTASVVAGDKVTVTYTTDAGETLGTIRATLEKQ